MKNEEPRKGQKRKIHTKSFQGLVTIGLPGHDHKYTLTFDELNYSFRRLGIHMLFEKSFDLPPVLPKYPPDDGGGMVPEFMAG